jgi:hypothetical protein
MHSKILFGFMTLRFFGLANIWKEFSRILCFGSDLGLIISKNSTGLTHLSFHFLSLPAVSGLMLINALTTCIFLIKLLTKAMVSSLISASHHTHSGKGNIITFFNKLSHFMKHLFKIFTSVTAAILSLLVYFFFR